MNSNKRTNIFDIAIFLFLIGFGWFVFQDQVLEKTGVEFPINTGEISINEEKEEKEYAPMETIATIFHQESFVRKTNDDTLHDAPDNIDFMIVKEIYAKEEGNDYITTYASGTDGQFYLVKVPTPITTHEEGGYITNVITESRLVSEIEFKEFIERISNEDGFGVINEDTIIEIRDFSTNYYREGGVEVIEGTAEMLLQRFRTQGLLEGGFGFVFRKDEFAVMTTQVDPAGYNRPLGSTEPEGTFYVFSPDRGYFETARVQLMSGGDNLRVYDTEKVEKEKVLEFLNANPAVSYEMETLEEFMSRIEFDGSLTLSLKN